jgi:flagellar protein FliO/FliZ
LIAAWWREPIVARHEHLESVWTDVRAAAARSSVQKADRWSLKARRGRPMNEGESHPDSPSVMRIHPALMSAVAAVLGPLLLAPAAFAADGERTPLNLSDQDGAPAQAAGSTGGGLVRTIVGLAIVIGVIYGLYWILKQVKASREETASGSGLKTLATLPLGTNRSLHLVRAGEEIVLVGAGEHGVTPIRTYTEAEALALGLLEDEVPEAEPPQRKSGSLLDELRRRTVIR